MEPSSDASFGAASVVRVKIWDQTGRIVYSDEARLIGARYPMSPEERAEFEDDRIAAEVSDLDKPENRFEREFGELLEVYVGLTTPTGKRLRYEEYYRSSFIDDRADTDLQGVRLHRCSAR